MKRDELVTYLDDFLRVKTIEDSSNNGLQIEGAEEVTRLAFAVDISLPAIQGAYEGGAQMLIVHHGLFWSNPIMVTDIHRRRLGLAFDAGLSLYASHLPLDVHDQVGNNAVLARWLKLEEPTPFGDYKGIPIGYVGKLPEAKPLAQFVEQVEHTLDTPVIQVWPFGPATVQQVAIVSGGAAFLADAAAKAGADVFFTGEVSHSHYHQSRELGLNVVFGGHYATETAGVKALANHLETKFGLETFFLDLPTGA